MFKCLNCSDWLHDTEESSIPRVCHECKEVIEDCYHLECQLLNDMVQDCEGY